MSTPVPLLHTARPHARDVRRLREMTNATALRAAAWSRSLRGTCTKWHWQRVAANVTFILVWLAVLFRGPASALFQWIERNVPGDIYVAAITTITLMFVVPIAGTYVISYFAWHRRIRRELDRRLREAICFHCEYNCSQSTVDPETHCVTCPECGEETPVVRPD